MTRKNTEADMNDVIKAIENIDLKELKRLNKQDSYLVENAESCVAKNTSSEFDMLNHDEVEVYNNNLDDSEEYTPEIPKKLKKSKGKNNSEVCSNIDVRPEVKKRKNNKKKIVTIAMAIFLTGSAGVYGYKLYNEYKLEQLRLSELNKDNLDLKLIIDTVDDFGGSSHQLNWKEIASVLSVQKNNYTDLITKADVIKVCSMFFNKRTGEMKKLNDVVPTLEIKEKQKSRILDYYEDLLEFGYTPEKLKLDSPQMEFINKIKDGAFESYYKTGILPSITIAQAILESNWGESNLAKKSNNLFGIKADPSWKGEYVTFETKEYHNTMIKDRFRKYEDVSKAIMDHSEFLRSNPRYEEGGVFNAETYKVQALALQESGYSTAQDEHGNKTYANMLERLIRQYNLQILDWEVKYSSN